MTLPFKNFATIVGNAAAAVQGSAEQLLDLTVGSTLRAMLEAHAGVALWLQWLVALLLQTTRAATSAGPDLDTWVADFSLLRLSPSPAAGRVQLARFIAAFPAQVPVGLSVRTADGTQTFRVVAEPGNPLWRAAAGAFALPPGIASVDVPVVAVVPGVAGNVQAASVALIAAASPGIDTVENAAPMAGGLDAESDAALRTRFQLFLATRGRATPLAVEAAVLATRQGLTVAVRENVLPDGTPRMGMFTVIVDDGTGTPPASVLQAAAVAVELVRPIGSSFTVQPPTIQSVFLSLQVNAAPGFDHAAIVANVTDVVTYYIDTLPVGASLPLSRIVQLAYNSAAGIANVVNVTLDGGVADVVPGPSTVLKLNTLSVY